MYAFQQISRILLTFKHLIIWSCHFYRNDFFFKKRHLYLCSKLLCVCRILTILLYMLSHFSCVQFSATLWTVTCQAPLSMGFSRQEYWSGLPLSPPGDLSNPGIKPAAPISPALARGFFTTSVTWESQNTSENPSYILEPFLRIQQFIILQSTSVLPWWSSG